MSRGSRKIVKESVKIYNFSKFILTFVCTTGIMPIQWRYIYITKKLTLYRILYTTKNHFLSVR